MKDEYRDVCVVMCTYNGEKYLREQLDSIINQTYPILSIYIQDDCSTDSTPAILAEYQTAYPFIKYKINEHQLGVDNNFFKAFDSVKNESSYIAIADQDDVWNIDKIQKTMDLMGDNLLCFCRSMPFSSDGSTIHIDKETPNYGLERLLFVGVIYGHSMIFKTELLDMLPRGYFGWSLYDGLIAITAAAYNKIQLCDEFLCHYRRYASALTYEKPKNYDKGIVNIIKTFYQSLKLFIALKDKVKKRYAILYSFLSEHKNTEEIHQTTECKKVVGWLANQSFFSLLKVSVWCLKNRDKIFYKKEQNLMLSLGRAALFPILMYQYWAYLKPDKATDI